MQPFLQWYIVSDMARDEGARFELNTLRFLHTELETGTVFATIALESHDEEKRQRNRLNARKAYDTAKHFLAKHPPGTNVEQPDVLKGMEKLRNLLTHLGEKFEEVDCADYCR